MPAMLWRVEASGVPAPRQCASRGGVAWIPVQHQGPLADGAEQTRRFCASRGVACELILNREGDALLAGLDGRVAYAIVDRPSVRGLIVLAPEIKNANVWRLEGFGQLDRALDELVLLLVGKVCAELRLLRAEAGLRRARPVGFEDGRGDLG